MTDAAIINKHTARYTFIFLCTDYEYKIKVPVRFKISPMACSPKYVHTMKYMMPQNMGFEVLLHCHSIHCGIELPKCSMEIFRHLRHCIFKMGLPGLLTFT